MVPVLISSRNTHSFRLLYALASYYVPHLLPRYSFGHPASNVLIKRSSDPAHIRNIIFPILIPILVLLSGLFAGLTLGYMSLDETQLNVLSISGTP